MSSSPSRQGEAEAVRETSDLKVMVRVARRYLSKRWRSVSSALILAGLTAGLSGLLVSLLQPALNAIAQTTSAHVWRLPLILAGLACLRSSAQIGQSVLINRTSAKIVGELQVELYGAMVRADLARLRDSHTGGRISQAVYDTGLISDAASTAGVNLVQQSLQLLAAVIIMFMKDWRLALLVLLAGPILGYSLRMFSRRSVTAATGAMRATGDLSTAMMEGLGGIRVVKMEGRETYEEDRIASVVARRQRHIRSGADARGIAAPISEMSTMLVAAAVLAYEGWKASRGHPDIGGFLAFFGALLMGGQALRQVANLSAVLGQGIAAARRLFATLDVRSAISDEAAVPELTVTSGELSLENVSFSYGDGDPVLSGVTVKARRGETVALVGPSGAGKSTILGLIPRFYDALEGRVLIDGQDTRRVSLASLRRAIGLVTQEPFLFDDTIAANISYSNARASSGEIEKAARDAAAHEFIRGLPSGYETLVGEAGSRLSGGQRQRIAIARAFLKDAPILLLDEATSALDTQSEIEIQVALRRLMAGRTTVIIAHRLSTVRDADRIYVLEQGCVVESGSHETLIREGGLYARLARSQDLTALLVDAS